MGRRRRRREYESVTETTPQVQTRTEISKYSRPFPKPKPLQAQADGQEQDFHSSNFNAFTALANNPTAWQPATPAVPIMPKLTVGAVGDKYEQEADAVATQVVQQLNNPTPMQQKEDEEETGATIQRQPVTDFIQQYPGQVSEAEKAAILHRQMFPDTIQRFPGYGSDEEEETVRMKPMVQLKGASAGGDAAPELAQTIQRERGKGQSLSESIRNPMENAFGADFGGVRIHTDNTADQLNQSIQAKAFTTGQDVFFRQGAYAPQSQAGQGLIAHELTHVVQQSSSVSDRISNSEGTIQRALAGTHAALSKTSEGKSYLVGSSTWKKILTSLKTYERLEKKGNLPVMKKILKKLGEKVRKWLERHEKEIENYAKSLNQGADQSAVDKIDPEQRLALEKLSAARSLLRRISVEESVLSQGSTTPNYSDKKLTETAQDNAVGAQASKLDKLKFAGNDGFYQAEDTFSRLPGSSGAIGIPGFDPNWSGRSIAMKRIDQLISNQITAMTNKTQSELLVAMDFATHTRQFMEDPYGDKDDPNNLSAPTATMGVYLEQASGGEARKKYYQNNSKDQNTVLEGKDRNKKRQDQLALDDPNLQRALNKLQILDVICGQIDRHAGNYFILLDNDGNVESVKGIDNDMAFGNKLKNGDKRLRHFEDVTVDDALGPISWKGLPPIADKEMAEAIKALKSKDVSNVLKGLLTDSEIDAAVERFEATQQFLIDLPDESIVTPEQWQKDRKSLASKQGSGTYLGAARGETRLLRGVQTKKSVTIEGELDDVMLKQKSGTQDIKQAIKALENFTGFSGFNNIPEFIFASKELVSYDFVDFLHNGLTEDDAIKRCEMIAKKYAKLVQLPNLKKPRHAMKLAERKKTYSTSSLANTLDKARRMERKRYDRRKNRKRQRNEAKKFKQNQSTLSANNEK